MLRMVGINAKVGKEQLLRRHRLRYERANSSSDCTFSLASSVRSAARYPSLLRSHWYPDVRFGGLSRTVWPSRMASECKPQNRAGKTA
jgi:hypothetical protein